MPDLNYDLLSGAELDRAVARLAGWTVANGQLAKSFEFDAYQKGLVFASAVGFIADALDHHPDIHVFYKKVDLACSSHSAGGLTSYDIELARRIDAVS